MLPLNHLKWPEMRPFVLDLIDRIHAGHALARFSVPVVDLLGVFAPNATPAETEAVKRRGDLQFAADRTDGGTFTLPDGERALFELNREGFVLRLPARMSGRYTLRPGGFRIDFNRDEELEGCKRVLLLICNRVTSIDISGERVDVQAHNRLFNLHIEF